MSEQPQIDVLFLASDADRAQTVSDRLEAVADSIALTAIVGESDALECLAEGAFDCVVCDASLPSSDGLDVLDRIRDRGYGVPFVLLAPETRDLSREVFEREAAALVRQGGDHYPRLANRILTLYAAVHQPVDRRFEAERRERELRRAETVIDTVGDGVYVMDREGYFTMVNGAFTELTGYERDELVGEHLSKLLDEDGLAAAEAVDAELERSEDDHVKREFELYAASGEAIPCEVRVSAIERDGEFVSTAGVVRDVSERRARERELRRKNELFERTQELATVGGWELDLETDTLTWTDEVYRIQGVDESFEPTLEKAIDLYHPEDQPKVSRAVEAAIEDDDPFDLELRVPSEDDVRWVRAYGARSTREDGDVLRGAVQEVTERKRRERELRQHTEQLEAFGRTVAHDLRNPLEIAQGYLDHLDADDRAAEEIGDAIDRMETVVDEVLTLARRGDEIGDREPVSVRAVAEDA